MGVPALFRWLSSKYPKIISQVIEEQAKEIDGQKIPVDIRQKNPNGEELDNLYLDMNGIVHPCSHPEDRPPPATEEEMMLEIFKYTERLVNMVRPRRLLMIAVDGVAPRAKMNQQRSRRFRSAKEAKEKDEEKEEFYKMLKAQGGDNETDQAEEAKPEKTWDSNAITPGTPFMDMLAASLKYWCAYKVNTDPGWAKLKVIVSDASVPGEGEHKIMEFIRSQRRSPDHDPNTRHVICGLDADLIMLGLATHEPHFRVLREDVFFQESKARTCRLCGQKGHVAEACRGKAAPKNGEFGEKDKALADKPFIWLHVSVLREYLAAELNLNDSRIKFDLERAIDDWVFMCFFVGNDFLPHLPSLDIRENGIDTLIAIWRDSLPLMGGYVTEDGSVNLERAQLILDGLAKQEDAIFRRRKAAEDRREAGAKRRKMERDERERNNGSFGDGNSFDLSNERVRPNGGQTDTASPSSKRKASQSNAPPPDLPLFTPGARNPSKEERAVTHEMIVNRNAGFKANQANKSAAAVLKSRLLKGDGNDAKSEENSQESTESASDQIGGSTIPQTPESGSKKRKAAMIEEDDSGTPGRATPNETPTTADPASEEPVDDVRLWEDGYADRYYEHKFHKDPTDIAFRNQVARDYVEGLAWVLLYYFQGCPSWTWYYPHHYAPFAADFVDMKKAKIDFKKGKPFRPFEQLMGVLPAASNRSIPEPFRPLMEEEDSDIIDFYPENFPIDLNGKKFAWQGVALLPFIDEDRLLKAMATKYSLLSPDDVRRNQFGKDFLVVSDQHGLYDEIAKHFFSKKKREPQLQLNAQHTQGLTGLIEKVEDTLPRSTLVSPLKEGMPDLDDDRSITVYYHMPESSHVHKSMLLRGLKHPDPVLNQADLDATRQSASRSGRSYGGVPFRNPSGGGRFNYANDRQNPIAKYLDPNFQPPPAAYGGGGRPPYGAGHNNHNGYNGHDNRNGYDNRNDYDNRNGYNGYKNRNNGYSSRPPRGGGRGRSDGPPGHYGQGPPREQHQPWRQQSWRQQQPPPSPPQNQNFGRHNQNYNGQDSYSGGSYNNQHHRR